jgi:hypothetical protein
MADEEFDWRKARKERKEIEEEDYEDDPDEQPATDAVIEALGVNPDELFAEEEDAEKTKNN